MWSEPKTAIEREGFSKRNLFFRQLGCTRSRRTSHCREGTGTRGSARIGFAFRRPAEEAAIAILAAKWPNSQLGQKSLEKTSSLGPAGSLGLTPGTTERHGSASLEGK